MATSYEYALAIYKYLENASIVDVENSFKDKSKDKDKYNDNDTDTLLIIELYIYLSTLFIRNLFGKYTKNIGAFDFKYTPHKKYYEHGGKYHNNGMHEDMFISYTLSVKLHDEDNSKYTVIYSGEEICKK